jgi:hypothetical protein
MTQLKTAMNTPDSPIGWSVLAILPLPENTTERVFTRPMCRTARNMLE